MKGESALDYLLKAIEDEDAEDNPFGDFDDTGNAKQDMRHKRLPGETRDGIGAKKLKTETGFTMKKDEPAPSDKYKWVYGGVHHNQNEQKVRYFRCDMKNCNAKKREYIKDHVLIETQFEGEHLHPPPLLVGKVTRDMKQEAGVLALAGAKPKAIHNVLAANAKDGEVVPTAANISKLKYALKMKSLPTGNSYS